MSVYFLTYVWLSKLRMWENSGCSRVRMWRESQSKGTRVMNPLQWHPIAHLHSALLRAAACGGGGGCGRSRKNMFGSRWKAELKLYRRHICSSMIPGNSVQWCAGKYLTNASPGTKNPCSVMAANFHSINTPTMVNFKLPTWPHSMQIWEEMWSWPQDTGAWPFPPPSPRAPLKWGAPLSDRKLTSFCFRRKMTDQSSGYFCSHWLIYLKHFSLFIFSSTPPSGLCRNFPKLPTL